MTGHQTSTKTAVQNEAQFLPRITSVCRTVEAPYEEFIFAKAANVGPPLCFDPSDKNTLTQTVVQR